MGDPRLRYNIAERSVGITPWEGVEVRVVVLDPRDEFSQSHSHIIDRTSMENLVNLRRTEELEMQLKANPAIVPILMREWAVKNQAAIRTLEVISHLITNAIGKTFLKER